ncbi:MAG: zinc-ribbon domain-containing protein [Oscillospiraceae bacterium]
MFCVKCGKPLDEGTRFCLLCGAVQDTVDIGQEMELPPEPDIPEIEEMDSPTIPEYSSEAASLENSEPTDTIDTAVSAYEHLAKEEDASHSEETFTAEEYLDDSPESPESEAVPTVKAKAVKPDRPRKKPMSAGFSAVLCVLFSLLTLTLTVVSTSLWTMRDVLQSGSLSATTKQVNPLYFKAKDVIRNTDALEKALARCGIAEVDFGEISPDETVGDMIDRTFADYGLSEEEAEKFLEKSELMPYLSHVVSSYETYLLTGEDNRPVNDKKLKETALSCMDYASKELGFKFRPDSEKRIDNFIRQNRDLIKGANPSEALGVGGSYIRYAFSLPVVIAASVLTLLFAVLVGLITRRADAAFATFGIPTFISGLMFLYMGLFPRLVLENANIPSAAIGDSIETAFGADLVQAGTIETVVGIVFVAAFIVYRVLAAKIAKKRELQND